MLKNKYVGEASVAFYELNFEPEIEVLYPDTWLKITFSTIEREPPHEPHKGIVLALE